MKKDNDKLHSRCLADTEQMLKIAFVCFSVYFIFALGVVVYVLLTGDEISSLGRWVIISLTVGAASCLVFLWFTYRKIRKSRIKYEKEQAKAEDHRNVAEELKT